MSQKQFVETIPERETALHYFFERMPSGLLGQSPGAICGESGKLTLVTASEPPTGVDYDTDWSTSTCNEWLFAEILDYVATSPASVVIFQDPVTSPSDGFLNSLDRPPYWTCQETVFWPVTSAILSKYSIEQVMAWSAGMLVVVAFAKMVNDKTSAVADRALSFTDLQQIAASTNRVAVSVFDGGGYLVWAESE